MHAQILPLNSNSLCVFLFQSLSYFLFYYVNTFSCCSCGSTQLGHISFFFHERQNVNTTWEIYCMFESTIPQSFHRLIRVLLVILGFFDWEERLKVNRFPQGVVFTLINSLGAQYSMNEAHTHTVNTAMITAAPSVAETPLPHWGNFIN